MQLKYLKTSTGIPKAEETGKDVNVCILPPVATQKPQVGGACACAYFMLFIVQLLWFFVYAVVVAVAIFVFVIFVVVVVIVVWKSNICRFIISLLFVLSIHHTFFQGSVQKS